MGLVVLMVYGPFLLLLLLLLLFGGPGRRRVCLFALLAGIVASGVFHLATPQLYPQARPFERTWVEILAFPFLVCGAWLLLNLAAFLRRR